MVPGGRQILDYAMSNSDFGPVTLTTVWFDRGYEIACNLVLDVYKCGQQDCQQGCVVAVP